MENIKKVKIQVKVNLPQDSQASPPLGILLWGVCHLCLASRSLGYEPPEKRANGVIKTKKQKYKQITPRLVFTMTIQKLSSGSKKNCRFFCVCRDFAGLMGQKVLKENKGLKCTSDDQSINSATVNRR